MAGNDDLTFGVRLRRYRLAASLSQEALAERAGLSTGAIAALENGRRTTPRLETVRLLATALGLDPAQRSVLLEAATGTSTSDTVANKPDSAQAGHPVRRSSLPLPPTLLMGREHEQATVYRLLQQANDPDGARLLSLVGPGGVGKTRLALAAASVAQDLYTDGVIFVDLSPLRDPALVAPTIAQAIGVRESGDQTVRDLLVIHLRDRHLLLVLDNAEQIVEAAPLVAELLAMCPRLVVMVTSRSALHVRSERRFQVPPLAAPQGGRQITHQELASYPAVQLFASRAQAVQPDFKLDATNIAAVAEICRRLDGLPLAIELAAARVSLLPPQALLARLDNAPRPLGVLSGGPRDLPVRQHTLRATFAWSYDLLSTAEQVLLRRLTVFAAGCTLEAAEAVCQANDLIDSAVSGEDILDGLNSLIDKSLLQPIGGTDSEPRFGMLETIREYGQEHLAENGETDVLRHRHAAYYQELAERAEPALTGTEQVHWLEHLEREHDNMRAALQWARETGDMTGGLRLAATLWRFWYTRGHLSEGRRWLEAFLAAPCQVSDTPNAIRAKGLLGAGVLARMQGEYDRAATLCEESLALYQQLEDSQGIAIALNVLGNVAVNQGDNPRAVALSEESLSLQRKLGDKRGIAVALNNLGVVVLNCGDYQRASTLCEESLALARELGDNRSIAAALSNLADVAREQGHYERALALYAEGLPLYRSSGDNENLAICLEGIAAVAGILEEHERAVRLCGAAAALRDTVGVALSSDGRLSFDRTITAAQAALGIDSFQTAWVAGQVMSIEEAISDATTRPVPAVNSVAQ